MSNSYILVSPIKLIEKGVYTHIMNTANTIEQTNPISQAVNTKRNHKTAWLSTETFERLAAHAKGFESVDQTINRILSEREGKENPSGGSF